MLTLLKIADFIRKPWAGWAVAGVLLVFLCLLASRPRQVEKVVEWRERTTTKYIWSTRIETRPGATVYVTADGDTTIYGPATFESQGSRETSTEASGSTKLKTTTTAWRGAFTGSVLFPRSTWSAGFTWNVGRILFFDVGAGPCIEAPLDSYVPRRFGGIVTITF